MSRKIAVRLILAAALGLGAAAFLRLFPARVDRPAPRLVAARIIASRRAHLPPSAAAATATVVPAAPDPGEAAPPPVVLRLRELAVRDPAAALALADAALDDADSRTIAAAATYALLEANWPELAQQEVELWSRRGRAAAIGSSPFQAVAWQLARDSDRAAAEWLARLPDSAERNVAMTGTAANWANHDPRAAMAWAESLPDFATRAAAMGKVLRVWGDHDPGAAADWVAQNSE